MLFFITTTLMTDFILPLLAGVWLGRRVRGGAGIWLGLLRGYLFVFAGLYLGGLLGDFYQWNTYWPSTSAFHMFGPDWAKNALMRAASPLKLAYFIFFSAFGIRAGMRLKSEQQKGLGQPQ